MDITYAPSTLGKHSKNYKENCPPVRDCPKRLFPAKSQQYYDIYWYWEDENKEDDEQVDDVFHKDIFTFNFFTSYCHIFPYVCKIDCWHIFNIYNFTHFHHKSWVVTDIFCCKNMYSSPQIINKVLVTLKLLCLCQTESWGAWPLTAEVSSWLR